MAVKKAIIAFSQSEKIKSGLIWASQAIELFKGLAKGDRQGAESVIRAFIQMISHEIRIAKNLAKDDSWDEVEKHMDMALVMANSQMLHESGFHLTRALSQTTGIAQRSLTLLKEEGLL